MSLQWHLSQTVPEDTLTLGQRLFRATNLYRQIGDRFAEIFPGDEVFASMYDEGGRGAEPPLLMALVTVFQMMERVPDRLAAELVVSRIDWKYALHLPLDYDGFHFTDLLAFRKRLLEHEQERLFFDSFLKRLISLGLIKKGGKVRTDSTHVLGLVEKLGRMELLTESVRVALRAVQEADGAWTEKRLPAAFLESYAQRQSEYGLSDNQVQTKSVRAGKDGFWLLGMIDQSGSSVLRRLPEVSVLRQVLAEQFPDGPDAPPPAKRPSGKNMIESPHEPEVRFGKKRDKKWRGYKVQVTETCNEGLPNLIVDLEPSGAAGHDSRELTAIQERLAERVLSPEEQYVDQGYVSGELIRSSQADGIRLMGKPPADTHPYKSFRQEQFRIDELAQQAICPAGQSSSSWHETHREGWPANKVVIHFSAPLCRACTFFNQCTHNPKGRTVELHPFRAILTERRKEAQQPDFRKQLNLRAGIEGTISELVRMYRLRYCRYRSKFKLLLQGCFTAIAANLRRLGRWWVLQAELKTT
jgi:transposase